MKIRAVNSSKNLLKVVRNPITDHIPKNLPAFAFTFKGEECSFKNFIDTNWNIKDELLVILPTCVNNSEYQNSFDFKIKHIKASSFALTPSALLHRILYEAETYINI